jgi:hypothetical protein
MKDPIVDEVRKYRSEHARKFNNDLRAICKDLRELQRRSGHPVVRLPPRTTKRTLPSP